MTGKIHVAVGVSTLALLCFKYPTGFDLFDVSILPQIGLFTAAAGSYAPDIDLGRSHAGNKYKLVSKAVSKFGGGHRGITHTLLVPALLLGFMIYINGYLADAKIIATLLQSLVFGFLFGWVMHIFADLFNGKGCPILFPLSRSKIHILDFDSSGWQAWLWFIIYFGVTAFIILKGVI